MIFIDKVKNAYFVKFGIHPITSIAMERIFINDEGFYPADFFFELPTYEYVDMHQEFEKNNEIMFDYLINIISKQGHEVDVKDCSILGFNAYQIIVPNFGENINDSKAIRFYQRRFCKLKKL